MKKKVSIVSYYNAIPFKYGLAQSDINKYIELFIDTPAQCAEKLLSNQIDIGLIPVISLPQLKNPLIISEYCIGAKQEVRTVSLYSDVPLDKIKTIHLDYQSKTTVALVKLLAEKYWNLIFNYHTTIPGFENSVVKNDHAAVIIGDRNFLYENNFRFKTDLAKEWIKFTNLPMVFACWVANKPIEQDFIIEFNKALLFGIDNITNALEEQNNFIGTNKNVIENYLRENIDYILDNQKIKGLNHFLNLCYPSKNIHYTFQSKNYEIIKQ